MDNKNNSGNCNSGHCNSGNCNSGHCNSGNCNSGHWNSGNCNSGHWNSGNWNSGNCNSGYWNSGDWNSGNWNSGDWNSGNCNSGYFCTDNGPVTFFDRPCNLTRDEAISAIPYVDLPIGCEWVESCDMTEQEKADNPNHGTIGGYLKKHDLPINQAFPLAWAKMDSDEQAKWLALPNFDADKFLHITGVDLRVASPQVSSPAADEISLNGVRYRRVVE